MASPKIEIPYSNLSGWAQQALNQKLRSHQRKKETQKLSEKIFKKKQKRNKIKIFQRVAIVLMCQQNVG